MNYRRVSTGSCIGWKIFVIDIKGVVVNRIDDFNKPEIYVIILVFEIMELRIFPWYLKVFNHP